jgi:hypothetical protein
MYPNSLNKQFFSCNKWVFFRLFVIIIAIVGVLQTNRDHINFDWGACLLLSPLPAIFLYFWLTINRDRNSIDLMKPFSLILPFYPMIKYPLRYWLLGSYAFGISGFIAMIVDIITHRGNASVGGILFFWGAFQILSLLIWILKNR